MTLEVSAASRGPKFVWYFPGVLEALKELGGSGRPSEVRDFIAERLKLSDHQLEEVMGSGNLRFDNQVAWARFYLVRADLIDSSTRGVWTLTAKGAEAVPMTPATALDLFRRVHAKFQQTPEVEAPALADIEESPAPDLSASSYRDEVLILLRSMPPGGFERFCQLLLRESGFEQVSVTGRSNDGGIDGIGVLHINPLVSFKVLFQCKRYLGTVGSSVIRDFRGAMMGRADKGIIITTGLFSMEAKRESVRDGVPPIELVDHEKLVEMMEQLPLGLVPVASYAVDSEFFRQFDDPRINAS